MLNGINKPKTRKLQSQNNTNCFIRVIYKQHIKSTPHIYQHSQTERCDVFIHITSALHILHTINKRYGRPKDRHRCIGHERWQEGF